MLVADQTLSFIFYSFSLSIQRDICDAARALCKGSKIAWLAAFIGLACNNWAIMGLHVNAGATAIQTIRGGKECTLDWAIGIGLLMFVPSLIRDFRHMSALGLLASSTMFICAILTLAGHGVQGTPNGYVAGTTVTYTVWAPEGTTFVSAVSAILNIVYTWVGQALIPSFVGDMSNPQDFPKALAISMVFEFCLFTITGAVVYFCEFASSPVTAGPVQSCPDVRTLTCPPRTFPPSQTPELPTPPRQPTEA